MSASALLVSPSGLQRLRLEQDRYRIERSSLTSVQRDSAAAEGRGQGSQGFWDDEYSNR